MKSPAVLFTAKNKIEFGEVTIPDPGPGDVVVRTTHSWISNGTEGSFLRLERFDGVTPWQPHMPLPYPMVPGYQKVGVVEEVGKDVTGFHEGQNVFVTITRAEGVHFNFAGHLLRGPAVANEVIALPEGEDPLPCSGLVLTQVGTNTGARPTVDTGCHALVVGDGMVGHWSAQTLQMRGAQVALVGRHDFRLNLFAGRQGDLTLNSHDPDWLEVARNWAGGEFDVVVDTVGNEVNYDLNMRLVPMLKWGGHFVTAGHEGFKSWIDLRQFIYREATIHCPCGWTRPRLEWTLGLIHEKKITTRNLITHHFPASQVEQAWHSIFTQKDSTLGVILDWDSIS